MKFIKKIYRSMLLFLAIALSVPLSANAAIPNVSPAIVPSKEAYTSTHAYSENGTFQIHSGTLEVRKDLNYNTTPAAYYGAGEKFYYQYVVEVSDYNHYKQHRYASYVTASGLRRYVYFMVVDNYNSSNAVRKKLANYSVW